MSDLLRLLLNLRESLEAIADKAEDYGYGDELPEIKEMQKLERAAFEKVNEWSKP
jgi:hypothetical protein